MFVYECGPLVYLRTSGQALQDKIFLFYLRVVSQSMTIQLTAIVQFLPCSFLDACKRLNSAKKKKASGSNF